MFERIQGSGGLRDSILSLFDMIIWVKAIKG